jgi:serine/threonine protein kinase
MAEVAEAKKHTKEIKVSELKILGKLGNGAFGEVSRAIYRGTEVAVKFLRQVTPESTKDFEGEIAINELLPNHSRTVQMVAVAREHPQAIVMDLYPHRSVEDYLKLHPLSNLGFPQALQLLVDVSAGLVNMHSENVIHRDIALRNALLKLDMSASIADFGLSLLLPEGQSVGRKTPEERKVEKIPITTSAPEALASGEYSTKSDVYMFGLLIWELFSGKSPFKDDELFLSCAHSDVEAATYDYSAAYEASEEPSNYTYDVCYQEISDDDIGQKPKKDFKPFIQEVADNNHRPPVPASWPLELVEIIRRCWNPAPSERPTMSAVNEMLRHFQDVSMLFACFSTLWNMVSECAFVML